MPELAFDSEPESKAQAFSYSSLHVTKYIALMFKIGLPASGFHVKLIYTLQNLFTDKSTC